MHQVILPYLKNQGELYIQTLQWPEQCACCGGEANKVYMLSHAAEYTLVGTNQASYYSLNWAVPYCRTCLRHINLPSAIDSVLVLSVIALWVGIGYGLFLMGLAENVFGIGLFILSLAILAFIGYRLREPLHNRLASTTPACTRQNCAIDVTSSASQQQVKLVFFNDDYANAFIRLNQL